MRTSSFNTALLLDRLAIIAPACLYCLGVCLLVRKVLPVPAFVSPQLLVILAVCAIAAWLAVELSTRKKQWFTPEYAAAWLDLHNHAGGKILAGNADAPIPTRLPGITLRHLLRRLVWPAVFVLAAGLVPAPKHGEKVSGAALDRQIAQVEQDVEDAVLAEVLPQPDAEDLRRQLQQVRDLALRNPEAAAEALSALPARLEDARTRRLELAAEALEKTMGAGSEWRNLENTPGQGDIAERMESLRQALDAAAKNEGGPGKMPANLGEACATAGKPGRNAAGAGEQEGNGNGARTGQLSREQVERMMAAMSGYAEQVSRSERSFPGQSGRTAAREGALSRLDSVNQALDSMRMSEAAIGVPGEGGVDRGRGDAVLSFGNPSSKDGLEVDYRPLTESEADAADLVLRRERALPDETLPPEEFRRSRRSGVSASERIDAGQGGAVAGPAREQAVRSYYEHLNRTP